MKQSRGFTLIEMLVSLAITMIMMGAVVTLFGTITDSVTGSRALIETADRLRSCRNRLQADLQGITVAQMAPPRRPENDEGYLEIIEGTYRDGDYVPNPPVTNVPTLFGDADDVLMFTTRSRGEPFVGKFGGTATIESQVAEVAYFTVPNGQLIDPINGNRLYTLYRRVLLVVPGTRGNSNYSVTNTFDLNDVSVHYESTSSPNLVPNTLGDLTKRENRFAHYPSSTTSPYGFPFNLNATNISAAPTGPNAYLVPKSIGVAPNISVAGDDVLMTNVLAFDVQVFDPNVPIQTSSGIALLPNDPGYSLPAGSPPVGGYVDLGYNNVTTASPFFNANALRTLIPGSALTYTAGSLTTLLPTTPTQSAAALSIPGIVANPTPASSLSNSNAYTFTYDTWSLHYEADGVQQNNTRPSADMATNGIDDDGNGIVDDLANEAETQAPFTAPLRGIKVTIRVYEPSSQQVREVTVIQDFLPE